MNETKRRISMVPLLVCAVSLATAEVDQQLTPAHGLDASTVAMVGDEAIPYDWFLHEFRSTFFRYGDDPDVRQTVFDAFLDRMILYEAAMRSGGDEDAALQQRVRDRMEQLRSYMEYQLAMTERSMVIEHYLAAHQLAVDDFTVTEAELEAFIEQDLRQRSGAPETVELADIPPQILDQLRQRLRHEKQQAALKEKSAEWMRTIPVQRNQMLIDHVPLPKMPDDMPRPGARPMP